MTASFLDRIPLIGAVRRNHALEHATMQVLSEKYQGVRMAGFSNAQGFLLAADLPTEIVAEAALEAERRLKAGESQLAVHPHCGTNLAAPALAAGAAAWLALWASGGTKKPRLPHFIFALLTAVPVFLLARPLGPLLQKTLTTSAEQGSQRITRVASTRLRESYLHKINTGE
ncbi:MAG: hypothetical protein GX415_05780 [Chloroflexi bacterium]|mgnify:CR=1 FL=1|nr:hypothetical protein [Anaerolineaceae bacterium]NLI44904.1 hypothetical protein [Chloroflexota bacterium]HOE34919.1 DUF6391 domain-containing protein [Anaerolineaceae bacterium]HOT26207.1 DUF6391 domain-containing protein [Anaerolineaceae bacterium]HQK03852.1 DUF6391 domain-containing protein [Anaerolineaceae bacterium]